ncbi:MULTISPECIES: long-chain-acyl-CoA synthetase [Gammaproteobacteria]|uniref:long-chain-acyl-CoA synthetase n=1 Tax=Gammaproteobacteria TaxID=1236 RepID=UPI000DD07E63|nr:MULTISPECIES: long-chain-acyl-CoA synthetase [Gammaproteobacteria]RTE87073.1 long-chain-acyl-CoA synthetase [Aliidiomarina sp. B3213]TCZ93137.1 long-chain-acyl-CoA synthetase [Lysobacter sp. N42]
MSNSVARAFRLPEMLKAWLKFLPRVPRFVVANIQLLSKRKHHLGSTGQLLEQRALAKPSDVFLRFEDQAHSYEEVNRRSNNIAHYLKAQGISKGDTVAVMFENTPELVTTIFALNKLGAIAALMNYNQRGEILKHSLDTVKAQSVIVGENCITGFETVLPLLEIDEAYGNFPIYWLPEDAWNRSIRHSKPQQFTNLLKAAEKYPDTNLAETHQVKLGDECFYVMTSGTTGLPKAAAMTHLRWYKAGLAFGKMALGLKRSDTQYCCLPFYHNTALSIALSSCLIAGATLAIGRKFSASQFWQEIHQHQATCFTYIGELCRYLLNQPVSPLEANHNVRAVIGNGLRAELWDAFESRFSIRQVCELYGASEGNIGFVNVFNLKRTVGFSPLRYKVVRFDTRSERPVVNAQGRLQEVSKGEVGLLLAEISPKSPFDGYTHNPKANEAKIIKNAFKRGDRWFNSGDLVLHQGFKHVAFIDRVGDTFRWKSENVATTEVEAYLQKAQGILEAVVYGVKVPHAEGRAGMASIVIDKAQQFNPTEFYHTIKQWLPDYALPLFVRLCSQVEKTATYKVMKSHLKLQGFQPAHDNEPIYVLVDKSKGYQRLDADLLKKIELGQIRF